MDPSLEHSESNATRVFSVKFLDVARTVREWSLLRPGTVVLAVLLSLLPAIFATFHLEIRTSLSELLPQSRSSVIELRRIGHRIAGASTLIVAIHGRDANSLKRLVDGLAPAIRQLGPRYVTGVDEGGRTLKAFVTEHKLLFTSLPDLERLRDEVNQRYSAEVAKRAGFDLELGDERRSPPAEDLTTRLDQVTQAIEKRLPNDYYLTDGGTLAAIVVATPFEAGDPRAFELEKRISALAARLEPQTWDPTITVRFTGNLVTSAEEHRGVTRDLAHVGTAGVSLILVVVFLFFLRLRALFAMLLTIAVGCLWSFGFAKLVVGHLNSETGFLVSIIAGNGINFGIILMARYLEAHAAGRETGVTALRSAVNLTAAPTLAVAACAAVAYGALAATDFRGFRHFGVIAGVGMALCWIASYTFLPAFLVLAERVVPLREDPSAITSRLRGAYGKPFAYLALHYRRPLLALGSLGTLASFVLAFRYVAHDPLEYDMRTVRNEDVAPTSARALARHVNTVLTGLQRDGRALVVDNIGQVQPLVRALNAKRDAAPKNQRPFERVVSAFDLLPDHQTQKIALLGEISAKLRRAHRAGAISESDWKKLEPEIEKPLTPLTLDDLPRSIAWRFEEADGTRGRIVYIVPARGRSLNDARYLMQWADSFREVRLPTGDVIRGTGEPVILADVLESVRHDAPKALAFALGGTLLVVLAAFRWRRSGWLALSSVLVGFLWLIGFLSLSHTLLNFLNFVALPISIGVGADYAINVVKRYEQEGPAGLTRTAVQTGGAVVLCSLTTTLGYGSLLLSTNGAVRSFGRVGAVGEVTAVLAAMLLLPAFLSRRSKAAQEHARPLSFEQSCPPPPASSPATLRHET